MTDPRSAPGRYLRKLAARTAVSRTVLCLGIDPTAESLPTGFPETLEGVERFARLLLEAAGPYSAAVKPNLAFFEAFGSAGLAALERLRALVPDELPVILDAKRADIGTTSVKAAVALYDALGADAVTVNPYLGRDAVEPFVARPDGFAYVLCRTSNPGAWEFQDLIVRAISGDTGPQGPEDEVEPLYLAVARAVATWAADGAVGLVVGANAPDELRRVRLAVPSTPFLVPGVGAQGGSEAAVLAEGPVTGGPAASLGGGLLVNVSRGIAGAGLDAADPAAAIAAAAQSWAARLRVLA